MPKAPAGNASKKGRKPTTKVKYRQELATVLGRAVGNEAFLIGLRDAKDRKKYVKSEVNVNLSDQELQALEEMDWETAATAAASLRATLPDREGGSLAGPDGGEMDLGGW